MQLPCVLLLGNNTARRHAHEGNYGSSWCEKLGLPKKLHGRHIWIELRDLHRYSFPGLQLPSHEKNWGTREKLKTLLGLANLVEQWSDRYRAVHHPHDDQSRNSEWRRLCFASSWLNAFSQLHFQSDHRSVCYHTVSQCQANVIHLHNRWT